MDFTIPNRFLKLLAGEQPALTGGARSYTEHAKVKLGEALVAFAEAERALALALSSSEAPTPEDVPVVPRISPLEAAERKRALLDASRAVEEVPELVQRVEGESDAEYRIRALEARAALSALNKEKIDEQSSSGAVHVYVPVHVMYFP